MTEKVNNGRDDSIEVLDKLIAKANKFKAQVESGETSGVTVLAFFTDDDTGRGDAIVYGSPFRLAGGLAAALEDKREVLTLAHMSLRMSDSDEGSPLGGLIGGLLGGR